VPNRAGFLAQYVWKKSRIKKIIGTVKNGMTIQKKRPIMVTEAKRDSYGKYA
jgi:hypothetical protein